jgi:hypothetical protein
MLVHDRIENMMKAIVFFEVPDIFHAACREVVEDKYFVTSRD